MATHTHVLDLLPAYALDCLDDDELIVVSEHLADCAECRAELSRYQTVADQLALAVPETTPPPELKARLMRRIQPPLPRPRRSWWQSLIALLQRPAPAWSLLAAMIIAALAIINLSLWQQVGQQRATPQPGTMRLVTLTGTDAAPEATGVIVISTDGRHGMLVVDCLPPLDQAHQYQLWLIQNGERTSGAVFSVNEEGYGATWISAPEPVLNYPAFGITIEPAGGSPGPTGDKVLGGSL